VSGYLLGIDYGTGGAKACIIDSDLNVLSYAFREYPIIMAHPGWSEHDPELYWKVCCDIIRECICKAAITPSEIKGIGTSAALPSLVMVDKNHMPLHNAYNLMDRRAVREVAWLLEKIGAERIFRISGNRLEDHPSIVNLLWEKNNRPDSFKLIYKALTIDGYIRLKLTGKATVSYSNATFYGVAYDIVNRNFNQGLLQEIGLDIGIMPEIFGCEDIIGEVSQSAAEETGLVKGVPVAAGQADACAGWVGAGAVEEGDIQMNLGTCGNFGIIHKDTAFINSMIVCAYTIDSKNTYVTIPTSTTGGLLIRYMRDNFSHLEVALQNLTGLDAYECLDMEAEKVNPGSDGLIVLPYLMGERTPL
jgi:ribulokinase